VRAGPLLLLASLALAASPARGADADDAVVVIRGSDVSVARPLTVERARDGKTEVEIVRVEPTAPPPAAARPPRREPEIVVVYVPTVEEAAPVGIPVGWWPTRARDRHLRGRHEHFPVRPFPVQRPVLRRNLRGR
jgi:hypothetical protein